MSGAFLSAVPKQLPNAQITVDWFHIVQTFTRALDDVRKAENRIKPLPEHLRRAVLRRGKAERLRWARLARTPQAARWRITRFINDDASKLIGESRLLKPMRQALQTRRTHAERVVRRWTSAYTNVRIEGLNGLFQAAGARARGYRNVETFVTVIYGIGSPAGAVLKST
jgi:transposase